MFLVEKVIIRFIILTILVFGVSASAEQTPQSKLKSNEPYRRALFAFEKKNYREALRYTAEAIRICERTEAGKCPIGGYYTLYAGLHYQVNEKVKAISLWEKSIVYLTRQYGENSWVVARARANIGYTYVEIGETDKGLAFLEKLIDHLVALYTDNRIDAEQRQPMEDLLTNIVIRNGEIYREMGRRNTHKTGEKRYDQAYSNILNTIGVYFGQQGEFGVGEEFLLYSIEVDAGNINSYINLGALYDQKEDHAAAVVTLKKALEIDKNNPEALYNLACSYALQGDAEQAFLFLEKAFSNGFKDFDFADEDSSLALLHTLPRYQELREKFKKK